MIDSRGGIYEYRLTYTGLVDEQVAQGVESVHYAAIGTTTIDRPTWYKAALNATATETDASSE